MSRATALVVLSLPFFAACVFQRFAPTQLLRDEVEALVDESRWGRVDLASERVTSSYRGEFLSSRRDWGRDVRIADAELTNLVLAEDMNTASATIEVTWYDQRTMEVSGTVLSQRWVRDDERYMLEGETVVSGDDALLAAEDEEDDAGVMPSRG
jgi:hypothetical protein